jgi:alanyl aminopeptidase
MWHTGEVGRAVLVVATLMVACSAGDPIATHVVTRPPPPAAPGFRLPASAVPIRYDLRLDIDPDVESFRGHADITVRLAQPTDHIWLHAVDLDIDTARYTIAGADHALVSAGSSAVDQMVAYSFGRAVPAGDVVLHFDYRGHTKRDQEGLFRQRSGDGWYLFSQSESMFARRILPCFDEPELKAAWRVTIVAPAGDVALANSAAIADKPLPDGRHEVRFADIDKLPSYLFAIAVGGDDGPQQAAGAGRRRAWRAQAGRRGRGEAAGCGRRARTLLR